MAGLFSIGLLRRGPIRAELLNSRPSECTALRDPLPTPDRGSSQASKIVNQDVLLEEPESGQCHSLQHRQAHRAGNRVLDAVKWCW